MEKSNRSLIMNSKLFSFIFLFLCSTFLTASVFAEGGDGKKSQTLDKTTGVPIRTRLNINNLSTVIKNDGISDIDAQEQNSGLVYPKGSGKTAVFESGLLWGARITGDDQVRVGGSAYRSGLQGGKITNSGQEWPQLTAEGDVAEHVRIYRVRPDIIPESGPRPENYTAGDITAELNDLEGSENAIIAQYELDWTQWPAADGAPYTDVDGNGTYNPAVDIPGVPGANQTIWYVANDLNQGRTNNLYGADPLGIEMQATFWAYSQTGALGNMFFRKYKLINKSSQVFNDMYVSMWSDVDLGNSPDDFGGCDTTLSLGYVYNANGTDATYNPLPPPAVGFDFFQGPLLTGIAGEDRNKNGVDDAADFGIFNGQVVGPGLINLPMTAFYYFARGDASVTDPTQGDPQGSNQYYNFFQGRIGLSGNPFFDPTTGESTTYALSGDPQTRQGWLDGQLVGLGDRRIGSASGPFQMEPGDTQEVVVAEIVAGALAGVDRISAIGLLKFYDQAAQVAYDNFFDLPVAPPPPIVTVTELDNEIVLDWSKNNNRVIETETSDAKGYAFQGYNVYQLPSQSALVSEGLRIATYDLNDGIGRIFDQVFDSRTGSVVNLPVQFGNETGLKRYISITQDAINQRPLINGLRYYYAVTSYSYNPDPLAVPNNLENPISIITVIPHTNDPGITLGEGTGEELDITHNGTADGGPTVAIVDPAATIGHDYEVFFTERQEIRNANGDWIPASTILRKKTGPNEPDTLTGSSIDVSAVYGTSGDVELHCVLNLESVDGDWADGISMTLPADITILDVPSFQALNADAVNAGIIDPEIVGNTIILGDITHPYTGNGPLEGTEEWIIYVNQFTPPVSVDWTIFDDGFGGGPVDAEGTTTVTEIGNLSRLAKYWNLRDVTAGTVKLQDQSVIGGTDIFPDRDDIATNPGTDAAPVIDGFQINLSIGYAAPLSIDHLTLNGASLSVGNGGRTPYDLSDFTIFGNATGTSNEAQGYGSLDVNDLQQDYEFRFTGVTGDTVINGQTVEITVSGGSMATLYGARQYASANHPLNPTPGSADRFLVRIPFEVWNVDQNIQINYQIYDRGQADPAANGFKVWNTDARMYAELINTPYAATVVPEGSEDATWNNVWYFSQFTTGDVIGLFYANPIQIGVDTYTFRTTQSAYSNEVALEDITKMNVFPNPYYGVNSEELNKYNRFVSFSHLPVKATIRIFNLAGVLVRTIEKDDATTQFQRWDLANESGLPVASGLYIAYIDLPDLGTTKILKLAIIQEQQILDRF
jgi:hypothetical protein